MPKPTKTSIMLSNHTIKIVIADDHQMIRTGIKRIIQEHPNAKIEIVDEVVNGSELLHSVEKHHPHLAITDIRMPVLDGIAASKIICERYMTTKIMAFSMFDDTNNIMQMIQSGARGYVVKTSDKEEIIDAITTVARGDFYYCSSISNKIFGSLLTSRQKKDKPKRVDLSPQEIRIMRLICRELTTKEIAAQLQLAIRTVESYRQNMQEKIGAKNVVGIVLYALLNEIVQLGELC